MIILCGDIGGTKTLLQLCRIEEQRPIETIKQSRFISSNYDSLNAIIAEFLDDSNGIEI